MEFLFGADTQSLHYTCLTHRKRQCVAVASCMYLCREAKKSNRKQMCLLSAEVSSDEIIFEWRFIDAMYDSLKVKIWKYRGLFWGEQCQEIKERPVWSWRLLCGFFFFNGSEGCTRTVGSFQCPSSGFALCALPVLGTGWNMYFLIFFFWCTFNTKPCYTNREEAGSI